MREQFVLSIALSNALYVHSRNADAQFEVQIKCILNGLEFSFPIKS